MNEIAVYFVDPSAVGKTYLVAGLIFGCSALVSALIVVLFGWRAWWAILFAGVTLPTAIVCIVGGARPMENWPIEEFLVDVFLPLALFGLPSALVGGLIGSLIRALRRTV